MLQINGVNDVPSQCKLCLNFDNKEKSCKVYEDLVGQGSRIGVDDCPSFIDMVKSPDLDMLLKHIDEDEDKEIEQAVTKVVERVLDGYEGKMKVMVVGIARRKIKAMVKMVDIIDILLSRLSDLNTNMLEDMNSQQVIRLLSELNTSVNNDLAFIMKLVSPDSDLKDLQVFIDQRQVNINGSSKQTEVKAEHILQMTGASRDKIRDAFDALLNNIETPEYGDTGQPSEEDTE
jgi:hypothetical protein